MLQMLSYQCFIATSVFVLLLYTASYNFNSTDTFIVAFELRKRSHSLNSPDDLYICFTVIPGELEDLLGIWLSEGNCVVCLE